MIEKMKEQGEVTPEGIFHQMKDNGKSLKDAFCDLADTLGSVEFEIRNDAPNSILCNADSVKVFTAVFRKNKQKYRTKKLDGGMVMITYFK